MKTDRRTSVGRVLLEAALVAVVGAAFAFAANHVSPRGLALDRDYFPAETNDVVRVAVIAAPADSPAGTNPAAPSSLPPPAVPTTGKALQLIDGRQTVLATQHPAISDKALGRGVVPPGLLWL